MVLRYLFTIKIGMVGRLAGLEMFYQKTWLMVRAPLLWPIQSGETFHFILSFVIYISCFKIQVPTGILRLNLKFYPKILYEVFKSVITINAMLFLKMRVVIFF